MIDTHTPGRGCGCSRCKQPVPYVEVQTPEQAAAKQSAYQVQRAAWRATHGIPSGPAGRGTKSA